MRKGGIKMSERDRRIYRSGKIDMFKILFGFATIAAMLALMFGQAFMW